MKVLKYFIFVLLLSCKQIPLDIYIAPDGNDNNSGEKGAPVKTLEKVKEIISGNKKQDIRVVFSDGVYYLDKTIVFDADDSGSQKHFITYIAENEGNAIISGGERLNLDWELHDAGIYKATIQKDVAIDQFYINGERQRMARFPNAITGKNVFDCWELIHTNKADTENDPMSRISNWKNPQGGYVHAMHSYLWGDMHWYIKGKNEDGTLNLEGGWQNNRPSPMHPRYRIVENIFEELDVPGEWFYDNTTRTIFYYPFPDTDISKAKVEIVKLKHLVEFNGTQEKPVKNISFKGFIFRHAARTFMENKEQLLRSDWTTYRGGAVLFNGAENCTIENCEFDQLGGNSIFINNYNKNILIKGCHIHHSGANGIAFVGDPATVRSPLFRYGKQNYEELDLTPGPKGSNYPQECRVEDCLITMIGRDEKQTSAVQVSMSHQIIISHCSIYDVPRAGINISEGTFGGHIIEFCDVFNTVLETGDHGSFNSWGRDRFWTPGIKETATQVEKNPSLPFLDMLKPNIIRNSRWRCDHGWDIDLDDGSTQYSIYNNVLLNGGLKLREGYNRKATNNVIINNSLHPHVWYPNSGDIFTNNIVFGAYLPAIMESGIAPDGKWGARLDSNLFVSSEAEMKKFQINNCDINSLTGNPLFIDAAKGDFRVKDDSPALKLGFKNFDMNKFGVISDKLKKISKQPIIPSLNLPEKGNIFQTYDWQGATVKSIETPGEQSAAGLPEVKGVVILNIPDGSTLSKSGLKVGDVIVKCGNSAIDKTDDLLKISQKGEIELTIFSNQALKTMKVKVN